MSFRESSRVLRFVTGDAIARLPASLPNWPRTLVLSPSRTMMIETLYSTHLAAPVGDEVRPGTCQEYE